MRSASYSRLTEVEAWGVDAAPPPPDTTAPTVPTGLNATAVSSSQIDLSWTASTDNVGVTAYQVYRDSSLVATLGNVTSYSDTGLTASTFYSYTVAACDAVPNCSAQSAAASATTLAASIDQCCAGECGRGGFGIEHVQQRLPGCGDQRQLAQRGEPGQWRGLE